MRTDADYLPALQQRELERVTNLLLGEFELALAGGTQPFRKASTLWQLCAGRLGRRTRKGISRITIC